MSVFKQLLDQYCPDGVDCVCLGNIVDLKRGKSITKKQVQPGNIPVIAGGRAPAYFHNVSNRDGETIVVAGSGAYAGFVSWWDTPIFVSDAFSAQTKDPSVRLRYVFHCMQESQSAFYELKSGGGVPHVYAKDAAKIKIPLPPLEIQDKIVDYLDAFAALCSNLDSQIEKSQVQFAYYRRTLIQHLIRDGISLMRLGDIGSAAMCKRIFKDETKETGEIPFYKIGTFGKEADAYISRDLFEEYKAKFSYPKPGELLISASGSIGRIVVFDGEEAYFQDSNIIWLKHDEAKVLNRFLRHCYAEVEWFTEGGTIKRLYGKNLLNTEIPVPPLSVQQDIADKLDTMQALIDNLKHERELRGKQLEYYRSRLLDFTAKESETND